MFVTHVEIQDGGQPFFSPFQASSGVSWNWVLIGWLNGETVAGKQLPWNLPGNLLHAVFTNDFNSFVIHLTSVKAKCRIKRRFRVFSTLQESNGAQTMLMWVRIRRNASPRRQKVRARLKRIQSDLCQISHQNRDSAWRQIERKQKRNYLQTKVLSSLEIRGEKLSRQNLARNISWR